MPSHTLMKFFYDNMAHCIQITNMKNLLGEGGRNICIEIGFV